MLKAKIHGATVTECDLKYEGSIGIDADLLKAAGIHPFEKVDIYNITNGERLTTYAINAKAGSGYIGLNGAAARKACKGDKIIICAYCDLPSERVATHEPTILLMDKDNAIKKS